MPCFINRLILSGVNYDDTYTKMTLYFFYLSKSYQNGAGIFVRIEISCCRITFYQCLNNSNGLLELKRNKIFLKQLFLKIKVINPKSVSIKGKKSGGPIRDIIILKKIIFVFLFFKKCEDLIFFGEEKKHILITRSSPFVSVPSWAWGPFVTPF